MSFINIINEKVFLPANDMFFGHSISKNFQFLNKSQWWTEEQLKNYQDKKLQLLITHAYTNVPYYTEIFKNQGLSPKDVQTQEDLHKLPILTKEIIKKNFPEKMIAKNIPKKNLLFSGTGGSTGEPLQYSRTKDDLSFSRACNLRGWYWMGFRLGDPYMKISVFSRKSILKKIQDTINRCHYIHSKSLTNEEIKHLISILRKNKLKFLRGFPASLYIIANYMKKNQIDDVYLEAINTTSEPLYPHMRELIEKKFHCPIFDSYGAEGSSIISQCEKKKLYHISSEEAICELLENDNKAFSNQAKMVFTNLHNYATPFIRYDVKDYITISKEKCSCGRILPTIAKIEGRDTDILISPSGKHITFHYFVAYFEYKDYIDMFQIHQKTPTNFTLKMIVNNNYNAEIEKTIQQDIGKMLGDDVILRIELTKDIPLAPSGKRRFFVREPNIPLDFF
jgi:phenylacetate-coenzyme A ligase PaaK-like adenylate-forming protein